MGIYDGQLAVVINVYNAEPRAKKHIQSSVFSGTMIEFGIGNGSIVNRSIQKLAQVVFLFLAPFIITQGKQGSILKGILF